MSDLLEEINISLQFQLVKTVTQVTSKLRKRHHKKAL